MDDRTAFGLWTLFLIATVVLVCIAVALVRPRGQRDWKGSSAFLAFVAAVCAEITLVPLGVYVVWRWLLERLTGIHASGPGLDLVQLVFGWRKHHHPVWLDWLGDVAIVCGVVVLLAALRSLLAAKRSGMFASSGVYGYVRHPLYVGFILVMFGFLLQWPALLTLIAFAAVAVAYARLARDEEEHMAALHGAEWTRYVGRTPRFIPRLRRGVTQS